MIKNIESEFRGLEERSHKGEKVRKNEIIEVEVKLSIMKTFLNEQEDEDKWYGWEMRKKVKWPIKEFYERKLRNELSVGLKKVEVELSKVRYGQRSMGEEIEVYICEPKKGTTFVECDESEEGPNECLT